MNSDRAAKVQNLETGIGEVTSTCMSLILQIKFWLASVNAILIKRRAQVIQCEHSLALVLNGVGEKWSAPS